MLDRVFFSHPRSIGETYFEHLCAASGFAGVLLVAGVACFVHSLVPCLFERTASRYVTELHERMTIKRRKLAAGDLGLIDFAI
ncbi:MAG TPA: DUF6356 family protein [Rhizomicrobium sp.]|jgi:hypothetical protein